MKKNSTPGRQVPKAQRKPAGKTFEICGTVIGLQQTMGRGESGNVLFLECGPIPMQTARLPLALCADWASLKAGAKVKIIVIIQ